MKFTSGHVFSIIPTQVMEIVGESIRSGVDEIVDEATGLNIAKIVSFYEKGQVLALEIK